MGKTLCSNCGQISCNGIDCYYPKEPSEMVLVRREDLEDIINGSIKDWERAIRKIRELLEENP